MPTQKQLVQMYSKVTILQKIVTLQHIYSLYLAAQQSKPPRKSVSFNILQLQKMINNSPLINPNFDFLNMKESLNNMRQKKQKGKATDSVLSAIQIVQVIAETLSIQSKDGKNVPIISQVPKTTVFMLSPKITIGFVRDRLIKILNNYKSSTLKDITALEMNYKRKRKEISLMEKGEVSDKDLREEFMRNLRHSKEIEEQQNAAKYTNKDISKPKQSTGIAAMEKKNTLPIVESKKVNDEKKKTENDMSRLEGSSENNTHTSEIKVSSNEPLSSAKPDQINSETNDSISGKASETPSTADSDSTILKDSALLNDTGNLKKITESATVTTSVDKQVSCENEEEVSDAKHDDADVTLSTNKSISKQNSVSMVKSENEDVSSDAISLHEKKDQKAGSDLRAVVQEEELKQKKNLEEEIGKKEPIKKVVAADKESPKKEIESNKDDTDVKNIPSSSDDEEMVDASLPPADLTLQKQENVSEMHVAENLIPNKIGNDKPDNEIEKNKTNLAANTENGTDIVEKSSQSTPGKKNITQEDVPKATTKSVKPEQKSEEPEKSDMSEKSDESEKSKTVDNDNSPGEIKKETEEENEPKMHTKKRSRSASRDAAMQRQRKKFQALSVQFLSQISSNRFASMFLHPVNAQEEPNYYELIKKPVDLRTLTKDIRTGAVTSFEDLEFLLQLMFSNAVMYNDIKQEEVYNGIISMMEESDRLLTMFKETIGGNSD